MTLACDSLYVGIDLGKSDLVVALHGGDKVETYPNAPEGIERLCAFLLRLPGAPQVRFEATGGYEWALWEALEAAGLDARQIPPAAVASFRRARGTAAKTDPIDARLIAAFAAFRPDAGRRLPHESVRGIKDLVATRRQRRTARTRLIQQAGRAPTDPLDVELLAVLERQIATLDARIAEALEADDLMRRRAELLRSIPGIGPATAPVLLAEAPELGDLSPGAAGALAGLAPIARDSGAFAGKRFIGGGRKTVRDALYMAATVAARHNPDLKADFERFRANGKPYKKAITAVARKLIVLANAVLKRNSPWEERET